MQYSTIAAQQVTNGATRPETTELHGRVRVAVIDTKITAADTDVILCRFPAGRIRILGTQSTIKPTLATGATTLKFGYGKARNYVGGEIAADDDAFLTATASTSVTTLSGASGTLVETSSGFDLTATASANMAVNDTINGVVLYIVD